MLDIKSVLKKCKKELEKLNLNEKKEEQGKRIIGSARGNQGDSPQLERQSATEKEIADSQEGP